MADVPAEGSDKPPIAGPEVRPEVLGRRRGETLGELAQHEHDRQARIARASDRGLSGLDRATNPYDFNSPQEYLDAADATLNDLARSGRVRITESGDVYGTDISKEDNDRVRIMLDHMHEFQPGPATRSVSEAIREYGTRPIADVSEIPEREYELNEAPSTATDEWRQHMEEQRMQARLGIGG